MKNKDPMGESKREWFIFWGFVLSFSLMEMLFYFSESSYMLILGLGMMAGAGFCNTIRLVGKKR